MLGPCRLPYTLIDESKKELDKGYLLSPRDLCSLEYIPFLINAGVTSFKIEGRMKTPEYVATVTRIYRKYIDLAKEINDTKKFIIDEQDKKDLLQVFNRGLSSLGHLSKDANKNLIFKEKPNNMGLPLGIVQNYNENKGYITLKLKEQLQIGDTISLENETGTYQVSELMEKSNSSKFKNIQIGNINQTVTIGRMKGNINIKDNVFKMSSKILNTTALNTIHTEAKKIPLNATVTIKKNKPISICITSANDIDLYSDLNLTYKLEEFPIDAINRPLTKENVIEKINKTGNSCYEFKQINVNLDDNMFLPNLSLLNELRRASLEKVESFIIKKIKRNIKNSNTNISISDNSKKSITKHASEISVLLNILNEDLDYSKLDSFNNLYIPLKYFTNKKYESIIKTFSKKFNLYIYFPTIIKANYRNMFHNNIENAINSYNIKGFVLSNISNFVLIEDLCKNKREKNYNMKLIANYTFNIYNNLTIKELESLGISKYTISPELDKTTILSLQANCDQELIVYGKIPLMNINYCLLGKTNKCFPQCDTKCVNNNYYYLKDRMNMNFEIIPDNIQTVTTIYNSKTLSILPSDFNSDSLRIDILHENIDTINNIIKTVKSNKRFEGKDFTNGNLNREI